MASPAQSARTDAAAPEIARTDEAGTAKADADEIRPDEGLLAEVNRRLASSGLGDAVRTLVSDALAVVATGTDGHGGSPAKGAVLKSVTVQGFRGIGPARTLDVPPGPGLTVVTGRNGSGKSSFAEGIEVALTGANRRWLGDDGKPAHPVQQRGWRNLHHPREPRIDLEILVPGRTAPLTVTRTWAGETFTDSQSRVAGLSAEPASVSALGWDEALHTFRPILSYSELGQMMTAKPVRMYDALATILGLGPLSAARQHLAEREKTLAQPGKRAKAALEELRTVLAATDDDRARAAAAALAAPVDPERVREVLAGTRAADSAELARLRRLADLDGPDPVAVTAAAERLRIAATAADDAHLSDAGDARARADLLDRALLHHQRHRTDASCPVCGEARLDEAWAARAAEQIEILREEAAAAEVAASRLRSARGGLLALIGGPPVYLPDAMRPMWETWTACREISGADVLAASAEKAAQELAEACRQVRAQAEQELAAQDERWLRVVPQLAEWLRDYDAAAAAKELIVRVKAALEWLKDVQADLRGSRMRNVAETAGMIWRLLCQESSVSLGSIELKGSERYNGRSLELDVTVDDVEAPALSVVSQGELFSLALALFLPRATAADSPFGFVVIDDPVQSMDPRKVEGLAKVLAAVAATRQVVVFSHDTRLADVLRYHRIPATVLGVTRHDRSDVEVHPAGDPVEAALGDARQAVRDLSSEPDVLAEVLPGLCRVALEAAFHEVVMRRAFGPGTTLREALKIEEDVDGSGKLVQLAALALFGERRSTGAVYAELTQRLGREASDLVSWCNRGSHTAVDVRRPMAQVDRTRRVAENVRSL
ncbi:AAA domain-containing protein [Actinacidiphila alni]|uniref:Nuclease SbcCD subunit C n=1 Tax=Actinacidiphila alni TaxID=380248 RepID=A0A1I2JDF5_9ACTN|nr:AAA family ATPase [Actinacidiphila alni]SFF52574.1 AAA domain-containing protein [Actinacidiphila alni]